MIGGYETLLYDVRDGIAKLILNRPDAGNTFTALLLRELEDATTHMSEHGGIRAVMLCGAGRDFCRGASIDMLLTIPETERPLRLREMVTVLNNAITRLLRLDMPVLGVVHGAAVGGGLALIAACDVVIAAASARFRMGWPGLGITMDGGASALVPRSIGSRRTLELVYTNRVFTATDAHTWGFVNWVVPDGELGPRSTELAEQLARGPTRAFGLTKRLVLDGWRESPEAHLEQEAMALVTAIGTQDASEALTAFSEHREPNFTGS